MSCKGGRDSIKRSHKNDLDFQFYLSPSLVFKSYFLLSSSGTNTHFAPNPPQTSIWISAQIKSGYLWTLRKDRCSIGTEKLNEWNLSSNSRIIWSQFTHLSSRQVSFYNVDAKIHIYTFNDRFSEGILPFFSPCTNKSGKNDGPLIITPVNTTTEWRTTEAL